MLILAFDKLLDKLVNLGRRDIGHDHHVRNVFFAGQLPSLNERFIQRPLQDDGATQVVQTTRETRVGNLVTQIASCFHAVAVSSDEKESQIQCEFHRLYHKHHHHHTLEEDTYTTSRLIPLIPFFLKEYHKYNEA